MLSCIKWLCLFLVISQNGVWCKSVKRKFPNNFLFGASTSAYQIEGGWNEDGKGPSIWDTATHMKPSPIKDGSTGDIAANSYYHYKRDVDMMVELGLNFYIFSISWARILPKGYMERINDAGVLYYNNLIDEMLKKNIQPFVTIYHLDLPENLQKLGGWANPDIVTFYADYARILFEKFGDRVKRWITFHDPKAICYEGYGSSEKAPFLNISGIAEYQCARNVLLAHARVYHLYDDYYRRPQNGTIGISIGATWYEPASETIDDHMAARDAKQFDWGQYANPIFSKDGDFPIELRRNVHLKSSHQGYPRSRLPVFSPEEIDYLTSSADFFGLSTFTTKMAYRDASLEGMYDVPSYMDDMGAVLVSDHSWPQAQYSWLQEVAWGFKSLLKEINVLYDNPPIFVTGNGWSSNEGLLDDSRVQYHKNYLNALLDAVNEGCNVKGYSVWSLMDNFEWKSGYREKFGLYEVDFKSPQRSRTPRKSAYIYKEIIRSNSLDPNYEPENFVMEVIQNNNASERDFF